MNKKKQLFISKPLKSKTRAWNPSTGRNNTGQITAWHRGGRHKRLYRDIDSKRKNTNGIVVGLEYDPNRSAFLARVFNPDKKINTYILAPSKIKKGAVIRSNSNRTGLQNGHSKILKYILTGSYVYNLSVIPREKGKILRAPGACGKILKRTNNLAKIRLKSGQYRWFDIRTIATNGIVSNQNHRFIKLKKAGQSRWLGKRPIVRGVAMNPIDHPHGGGEGKTSGGRPSVTPWAKPTKGLITRRTKIIKNNA
uniref:ribosomal protein L2 n=1 Tax=Cutleria multifida TaxID=74475 RepID=UPI002E78FE48|nr:ribosomal protein L2 [Cutleria multifida]WBP69883.1 ribosomal protein L2 [Cutleria multifida]